MLDIDRSEEILDGEFVNVDEPACVELVPVTQSGHAAARSELRRATDRNRRPGPADPQPAAGFAGGCAERLRRQPDPALQHRLPNTANDLDQR